MVNAQTMLTTERTGQAVTEDNGTEGQILVTQEPMQPVWVTSASTVPYVHVRARIISALCAKQEAFELPGSRPKYFIVVMQRTALGFMPLQRPHFYAAAAHLCRLCAATTRPQQLSAIAAQAQFSPPQHISSSSTTAAHLRRSAAHSDQ
ncbi:hypothetical protein NDU88_006882 [Pleurodeles waltl]|uniref:Uncharacterized protein n=1 Tax=Pleurodeles waltl TaxID=8319 RepID=A0AAV7PKX7_PLEWA|nr:hypothetical protein NDU88_006882 [Pleurodeles waltl]